MGMWETVERPGADSAIPTKRLMIGKYQLHGNLIGGENASCLARRGGRVHGREHGKSELSRFTLKRKRLQVGRRRQSRSCSAVITTRDTSLNQMEDREADADQSLRAWNLVQQTRRCSRKKPRARRTDQRSAEDALHSPTSTAKRIRNQKQKQLMRRTNIYLGGGNSRDDQLARRA